MSSGKQAASKPPTADASPVSPPYNWLPPKSPDQQVEATSSSGSTVGLNTLTTASGFDSNQSSTSSTYSVASHTVRITKHGYAIEPVELRYAEVAKNQPSDVRRSSEVSFDSGQVGHKILGLIRGFWSQPAFPNGTLAKQDPKATFTSIMANYRQNPLYPHRETYGGGAKDRPPKPRAGRDKPTGMKPVSPSIRSTKKKSPGSADFFSFFSAKPNIPKPANQKKTPPPTTYQSWIPYNKERIADLISRLCSKMETIFSNETRIIKVSSPCIVLGDIHGNLTDLRTYERSLWPKAPNCVTNNYLFLGDYVDRGDYSVECVLYLFAMKSIAPNRFFLLRGNHEVAAIQRQYTFGKECESKFGPNGRQLWRVFNKAFDRMPVAAVIDDQIFCAHGGIPRSISDLKVLTKEIPNPLDNPEVQCPSAWEILWNDPITDSELIGMIEMDNAVVTQTHITQTVPTPDGNDLVTTTTSSTAITSEVPAAKAASATTGSPVTTVDRNDTQPATDLSSSSPTNPYNSPSQLVVSRLNQADSILSREPPGAISFYIRPDNTQVDSRPSSATPDSIRTTASSGQTRDESDTLRTVPSDTSSIASTSPQQMVNDGFVANIKRGTAYLFSDQAIRNFLKLNNLSYVIRAHEVIPTGFAFHGDGRVITIFSSSKYCGLNNQAACAFVEGNRIRILRLDTGDAGE